MIKKWVKLLPYWLVMKFCRTFNAPQGNLNTGYKSSGKDYAIRYFQIDEGEFVVFSEDLQEIFDKRRRENEEEKINKKLEKINKTLNKDYSLKEELKQQIKNEEQEEKERREFEN